MLHLRRIAVVLSVVALSVSFARADVVSYFNFDNGNYLNSQLTPTVTGSPTSITGKFGEAMDFALADNWTFTGDQLVNFLSSLDKTCTITFWANTKSDSLNTGTRHNAFWLSNDPTFNDKLQTNRNMFTHYGYSNGTHMYFDAGVSNSFDRIDTNTTAAGTYPEGEWVHWAYVKDVNAGTMRVYRNGVELVSGGSRTRSVAGIVAMTIANDLSVQMDDFVVDNKALSSGEILHLATSQTALVSDTMNRSLSNASMEISPGGIGTVGTMRFIQQENIAYGRGDYASQNSYYSTSVGPNRAVDGNTNTTWGGGSMIHTAGSAVGDWWQVQFSDTDVPVDKVTIWNRTESGCADRLGNFTMNFYTEDPSANAAAEPVYSYTYSGTFPGTGTIDLPETFNASWVRITNGVQKALNISEVQIYTPTDNGGFSAASNNGAIIDGKNYQSYNLSLSGNSVLTMDVNGSEMDKVSVSGALTMGGTLKFNFIDASAVTAADINTMLAANSFSGKFDNIVFAGDDRATFDSKNIVIRNLSDKNLEAVDMVHWKVAPEDKNFANVNNWSSNPAGQNVAVGIYADEAADMTLDTSMSLGYVHFGYSNVVGDASLTLKNGADLTVTGMGIGENSRNTPTILNVESGAKLTDTGDLYVGHDGLGTLNVTGGEVTVNKLRPGYYNAGSGVVNISGGEVTVNAESEIGNYGAAEITVSNDAKLTFNGTVRIANQGTKTAFINLEDNAEMSVKNLFLGQRGANKGTMTLSGNSKLTVTDNLQIGTDSGSKGSGTMTLKDNAVVHVTTTGGNRFYLGYNAGTSTLNVADNASLTIDGNGFVVADAATGVLNQTGGTITVSTNREIYTGDQATGNAIFNISGGKFNANAQFVAGTRGTTTINLSDTGEFNANQLFVGAPGYAANSTSIVNQTGGTFNANAGIQYGLNANQGAGIYNLSGGTLNATTITRKADFSNMKVQFNMSGGVANIDTLAIPTGFTGGTLNAGTIDTTLSYKDTFEQSGGVLSIGGTDKIGATTITGSYLATQLDTVNNIARTGTPFKESGYQGDTFPANLANDGVYSNFAHTAQDGQAHQPYWGVSYDEDVNFGRVVVWNRSGWGADRLLNGVGFYVDVLGNNDNVVWQSQTFTEGSGYGFVVDVPDDVVGQKIRVVRGGETTDPMNIAEVEVYAYNPTIDTSNLPTLKFEIESPDSYDQLAIQGDSFDIGNGLVVLDLTSMNPEALNAPKGSTTLIQLFDLPDGVGITGYFADILLPELPEGESFDLDNLLTGGVIALMGKPFSPDEIPEPSTWALLLLGAAGLLYWRKKNA